MRVVSFEKGGRDVERIVPLLKKGKVLVLPTDTVYGLFCDAGDEKAVSRIFKIKQRSPSNPVGIFAKDVKMAEEYAVAGEKEKRIMRRYWPGAVTFILKKRRDLSEGVGTKETIGIRVPEYGLFRRVFDKIDFPLAQTSANVSGKDDCLDCGKILRQFKNRPFQPDFIFDAGPLDPAEPSTVVDLVKKKPEVIRQGGVVFE